MPYACVREATFEDWEWFLEAPKQYSPIIRNTFYALLDSRGLLAWILKFGGILGIYRLAFWKKGLFSVGGKSKIVVLFIGAIAFAGWLLYCRYGIEHYVLALEVVPVEILSLMLLAFILIGRRKQEADSSIPPSP